MPTVFDQISWCVQDLTTFESQAVIFFLCLCCKMYKFTVKQLKVLAKERGLTGYSSLLKQDLISLIESQNNYTGSGGAEPIDKKYIFSTCLFTESPKSEIEFFRKYVVQTFDIVAKKTDQRLSFGEKDGICRSFRGKFRLDDEWFFSPTIIIRHKNDVVAFVDLDWHYDNGRQYQPYVEQVCANKGYGKLAMAIAEEVIFAPTPVKLTQYVESHPKKKNSYDFKINPSFLDYKQKHNNSIGLSSIDKNRDGKLNKFYESLGYTCIDIRRNTYSKQIINYKPQQFNYETPVTFIDHIHPPPKDNLKDFVKTKDQVKINTDYYRVYMKKDTPFVWMNQEFVQLRKIK